MSNDVLDRIDEAVTAWEARPESWLPGDPLYERPNGAWLDQQTVRPMIELLPDGTWLRSPRCRPCGVGWRGPEPCWMCGEERPEPEVGRRLQAPVTRFATFDVTVDLEPYRRAMREAAEAGARMFEQYGEAIERVGEVVRRFKLGEWTEPERNGPAPLSIDGHAYRRKARNRRGKR